MLVVIANDLPPAVRGRMKLWFIEPRPNVFVSGIKDAIAKRVIEYLYEYCNEKSGLLIFEEVSKTPGYKLYGHGTHRKQLSKISGFPVVIEKNQ